MPVTDAVGDVLDVAVVDNAWLGVCEPVTEGDILRLFVSEGVLVWLPVLEGEDVNTWLLLGVPLPLCVRVCVRVAACERVSDTEDACVFVCEGVGTALGVVVIELLGSTSVTDNTETVTRSDK